MILSSSAASPSIASVLAVRLEAERAGLLQQLERPVPEVQAQDVALVGQELVADAEARHGGEVRRDDALGDEGRQAGRRVVARLDGVERLGLQRPVLRVGSVEVADPRVELPAVVVEAPVLGRDLGVALALQALEADHHVGDLDPRVVDVVLDADLVAPAAQQAHEGVAQRGVAQVADVGGLVWVDARVLDDDAPGPARRRLPTQDRAPKLGGERCAVEEEVHVAAAGHLGAAHAGQRRERSRQRLGDLPGLAPQRPGQIEGRGQGEIAQFGAGRVLERDGGQLDAERRLRRLLDTAAEPPLPVENHRREHAIIADARRVIPVMVGRRPRASSS
jgi:hypothetical protein